MRDMTEANRAEFESFMAERFTDSIDHRRCINGDGNDYMSWDMGVARTVWQHMQQKLDAVLAENVMLKGFGNKLNDMHNNLNGEGTGIQGRAEVACQQVALGAAMEEFDAIKTPATDAILNALRAEGIEILTGKLQQLIDEGVFDAKEIGVAAGAVHEGAQIAAQLRAETDTTSSRYESLAKGGV